MIVVRLREAMERFRRLAGLRMTYRQLSLKTGISESTLQSIAARREYNTTLDTVARIAMALDCPLDYLLEMQPLSSAEKQSATTEEQTSFPLKPPIEDAHGPQN